VRLIAANRENCHSRTRHVTTLSFRVTCQVLLLSIVYGRASHENGMTLDDETCTGVSGGASGALAELANTVLQGEADVRQAFG
jgi:hypothetical protein